MIPVEADLHLRSMRLINVKAFLEREGLIRRGKRVDRRVKVLEFGDEEELEYAILSHRWTEEEVDYNEIVELTKMDKKERSKIRQRDGYRKILQSCEQAKKDGHKWLWVDTCCIDKRSSAELSEAINSMYRWYENSSICYAYIHDLPGSSFPAARNDERYAKSNGWPEWFSRGWTLQEMIAPRDVRFFNKDWYPIGDKKTLAPTLQTITQVPRDILKEGLSSNRPCVAQIISWAANRTTTRVEDRAYSLMGLLDVNMPMLYGEGKKAFHRLQLEIIRTSNDQSIFAWGGSPSGMRTGSILADDPSFFWGCNTMELMNQDEFIKSFRRDIPEAELPLTEDNRLSTFSITNRGVQIWLFLRPVVGSNSVFYATLPCRVGSAYPQSEPVTINVALWESNYYRHSGWTYRDPNRGRGRPQLCLVYLRYQGTPPCNSAFEIDDCAITKSGFREVIADNTDTRISTDILDLKCYSERQGNRFAVGFGHWLDQNWIHVGICEEAGAIRWNLHDLMLRRVPEYALSIKKAHSGVASCRICTMETPLPRSAWILQTSCVMWTSSRICGVKLDVFQNPRFGIASGEWTSFDVDVSRFFFVHALWSPFVYAGN